MKSHALGQELTWFLSCLASANFSLLSRELSKSHFYLTNSLKLIDKQVLRQIWEESKVQTWVCIPAYTRFL